MAWSSASDTGSHWKSSHGSGSDSSFEPMNDSLYQTPLSAWGRMATEEVNSENAINASPLENENEELGSWKGLWRIGVAAARQRDREPGQDSGQEGSKCLLFLICCFRLLGLKGRYRPNEQQAYLLYTDYCSSWVVLSLTGTFDSFNRTPFSLHFFFFCMKIRQLFNWMYMELFFFKLFS
jgi:hypothetical protein